MRTIKLKKANIRTYSKSGLSKSEKNNLDSARINVVENSRFFTMSDAIKGLCDEYLIALVSKENEIYFVNETSYSSDPRADEIN